MARRDHGAELIRELDRFCRQGEHQRCSHVGARLGLRLNQTVACTCPCHDNCPAADGGDFAQVAALCTCFETGSARQQTAKLAGLPAKRQRFIRRGTPDDYTEVSVGFITGAVVVISGFVVAVVLAVRARGAVRTVAAVAAVVLGALTLWTTLLMGFSSLIVRLIRRSKADS